MESEPLLHAFVEMARRGVGLLPARLARDKYHDVYSRTLAHEVEIDPALFTAPDPLEHQQSLLRMAIAVVEKRLAKRHYDRVYLDYDCQQKRRGVFEVSCFIELYRTELGG
jgi:hypothetical protein